MSKPKITHAKITDLHFDPDNPNAGSERGQYLIDESFERFGAGRGAVIDRDNVLVAGNGAAQAFADRGFENVVIVETDGKTLVVTRRPDFDLDDPTTPAREYSIADNQVGFARLQWDYEKLERFGERIDLSAWFRDWELKRQDTPEPPEDTPPRKATICCPNCGHRFEK